MRAPRLARLAPVFLLAAVAACGSTGKTAATITSSKTSCSVDHATVPAGSTTFSVKNTGDVVTEAYAYQNGAKLGEVEEVAPGTTKKLTVTTKAGSVQIVCKPGEKGTGFSTAITAVAGK